MAISSAITVSDVDDTNIESAVIQITTAYTSGEDVLAFANTANITGSWDVGSGTLTLTGSDTLAAYGTALQSVTYQNTSENPDTTARTVTFTINDGDDEDEQLSGTIAEPLEDPSLVLVTAGGDVCVVLEEEAAITLVSADGSEMEPDGEPPAAHSPRRRQRE